MDLNKTFFEQIKNCLEILYYPTNALNYMNSMFVRNTLKL